MSPSADISGQRFGKLMAIGVVGKYRRENLWLCKCDCGQEARVKLSNLKSGNTTSCGCWQQQSRYRRGDV